MWFYYILNIENNGTTLSLVTEANMLGTFRKLTSRLRFHTPFFSSFTSSSREHGNHARPLTTEAPSRRHRRCEHFKCCASVYRNGNEKFKWNGEALSAQSTHHILTPSPDEFIVWTKARKSLTDCVRANEIVSDSMALSSLPRHCELW